MKRTLIIISCILLIGCSGQHKKLNKIIEKSSKVEVYVFDKDSTQILSKVFESNDPVRIIEFENYFTNKHTVIVKYEYSGKCVFKYNKRDVNVMFNLNPDSSHIAYMIDSKLYSMKLSEDGLKFLQTVSTNLQQIPIQPKKVNSSEQTD